MTQRALVDTLRQGGVIACPTETWVGLLADALNPDAVARVKAIKGPGRAGAIAVILPELDAVDVVADPLAPDARALAEAHWPGPLTLVVRAKPGLSPPLLQSGTIGVRVPGPSPALDLTRAFGGPLTATSANRTGEPPARRVSDLPSELLDEVDGIHDGESPGGPPSTIVDVTRRPFAVVRAGAVQLKL